MGHGRLFAEGHVTETEASRLVGAPAWQTLLLAELQRVSAQAKETEWFALGGQLYRRDRTAGNVGHLVRAGADGKELPREFLAPDEVSAVTRKLADGCKDAFAVAADDNYAIEPQTPGAPVYRAVCGEIWYHVDGASGAILERLDPSRRAYRWAYSALHTFDLPALIGRPRLRTLLIVTLCALGLAFSVTGVVIGWRRLRHQFRWRAAATRANNPRI
jgi:hypothetical protein